MESFLKKIYVEGPRSLDKDDRGVYYGLTHKPRNTCNGPGISSKMR